VVALCHFEISNIIKPGITTQEIDQMVENIILENKCIPAFKGYGGFPAATCCSLNEQVVHGFPTNIPLKDGDIISIDIGTFYKGYVGDSAWTYAVGKISEECIMLLEQTEQSLWCGLDMIKPGVYLSDVSHAIETHAKKYNLGIVRQFAGHGIGCDLHEEPEILNYGQPGRGPILKEGMTLAIEPMLNLGKDEVRIHADGWTTSTVDKKPSAHFEHSIVVTKDGYEVLTKL
ncbi:MAG: type I methionyl aminopeptidase, partial [Mycoplasmatales bacterium]